MFSCSIKRPLKQRAIQAILIAPIFLAAAALGQTPPTIVIDANVTILEGTQEPVPVQEAVKDLASDLTKVFGNKPRIVSREQDAGPVTIAINSSGTPSSPRQAAKTEAPESFSIAVSRVTSGNNPRTVIRLAGADMRGAIYAIYQFSEEYLGVDPMYYWMDREPARRNSIALPANLAKNYPPPLFRYRGLFINDEDLLTGWAPGEKDGTGISLAAWNKIYETILRLKGNMVVPGTWIFPDDPQVALATQRGLIVNQHHAIPLGLNVARWPKDVHYNYTTHPEILERAWKNAVTLYKPNQEVLWSVGLRGLSDVSYAAMDPSTKGNDHALGRLITRAIADQMRIVRSVRPDAKFVTDLWQEGARLMQQGDLAIPPEVTTVWADTGYGELQDDGKVKAGQGAYYHVAMMNNKANQLTEMVPVERIFSELGRYKKAGATEYLLLNTSDIRPVSMTTRAVMQVAWTGVPAGGSAEFYRAWAAREYGAKAAGAIADLYRLYFDAPARFGSPARTYGDQLYHAEARQMMLNSMLQSPLVNIPNQAPKWVSPRLVDRNEEWLRATANKEIRQCGEAQARWDAVWTEALNIEALVDPERRPVYRARILAMIAINRQSNRMLLHLSKAIEDLNGGRRAEAHGEVVEALKAIDGIDRAKADGELGKWKNWYRGDWLTGVYRTRQMVEIFAKYLDDPLTHLPPPVIWSNWEAYYHIMHYEGDRSVSVE